MTGGAGFIGSHLVEELVRRGHHVAVVDDFSAGSHRAPGARYQELDISSAGAAGKMAATFRGADAVFHLAAMVGVQNCFMNPARSVEVNVIGSHNVLEACANAGVPLIDISSSSVYGKAPSPAREESDVLYGEPGDVSWAYGMHKAVAGGLARAKNAKIVRPFNCIGPRQRGDYGFVVPRFIAQAKRGEDLTIYGDGTQTRSFCDVRDMVQGILLVWENGIAGEAYNVGSPHEVSINELAKIILRLTGSQSNMSFVPRDLAIGIGYQETMRRQPDLTKIQSLGFEVKYPLEDAIRAII